MHDIFLKINLLFQPIMTAVTLVYLYSILARTKRNDDRQMIGIVIGALFGVAAVLGMMNPIQLAPGILVDARNLFIGASFGLFGLAAGTVTLVLAVAMRAATGGAGMWLGIIAMVTSGGAALIWRHAVADRPINSIVKYLVLGAMISSQLVVGYWLPPAARAAYFNDLAPYLVALHLIGSLLLGLLMAREMVFRADAKALQVAADTDALTGLLNRRSANDAIERLLKSNTQKVGTAVVVFDIDHFKAINDSKGHAVGDAVLVTVTKRISGCLRPDDLFIRLGGDEFCVVMPCTSQGKALAIASRCRKAIADEAIMVDGTAVAVTISVGVSWTASPQDLQVLISAADTALYSSKQNGRDTVSLAPCSKHAATGKRHAA